MGFKLHRARLFYRRSASGRNGRLRNTGCTFLGRMVRTLVEFAENHFASGCLQNAGHSNVDCPRDLPASVVHYNHGAVVQVSDTLVVFLPFLENENPHGLTRKNNGPQGIRKFVDIQNLDAVDLRDLIEIEIVGYNFAVIHLREFDQLQIDFPDIRHVVVEKLHIDSRHFLKPLQHIETASAPVPLHGIGRIGDELQLTKDKLRNRQHAIQKSCLRYFSDTSVDNHAGVQQLHRTGGKSVAAQNAHRVQVEHIRLADADEQPYITGPEWDYNLEERRRSMISEGTRIQQDNE